MTDPKERVDYDEAGELDEVVAMGGVHLERLDTRRWFLSCIRSDGSEFCVWFKGRVTMTEERPAPPET